MSKDDDKKDIDLFREAMKNVKPLRGRKTIAVEKNKSIPSIQRKPKIFKEIRAPQDSLFSDHIRQHVSSDEKLFFTRGGLQQKLLRDFQQGKIRPERIIDLHGMTVEEARKKLTEFLLDAVEGHMRCVCIVHGKGKFSENKSPVLKNHVNSWLPQYENVLAFSSAQPRDGGRGAVYVLLKKMLPHKINYC